MTDAAGSEAWSYNTMARLLTDQRTTNGATRTFTYEPNYDGSIASISYPSGRTVSYGYNGAARPVSRVAHTCRRLLSACMRPLVMRGEESVTQGNRRHAKKRHVCATRGA
jgi:YD repeat-containing protein